MWNWDYNLPKNWKPTADFEWEWFLLRKINYGDFAGLRKKQLKKYFPKIKDKLDLGRRLMFENFLYENIK